MAAFFCMIASQPRRSFFSRFSQLRLPGFTMPGFQLAFITTGWPFSAAIVTPLHAAFDATALSWPAIASGYGREIFTLRHALPAAMFSSGFFR